MSFYVTLPSNSSMKLYPSNTQSNFTTTLANTLVLNNNYQVGLAEITYNQSVSVSLGFLEFNCKINDIKQITNKNLNFKIELLLEDGFSFQILIKKLNDLILNEYKEYYNKYLTKNLSFDYNFDEFKLDFMPEINYVESSGYNIKLKPNTMIDFEGLITELLQLDKLESFQTQKYFEQKIFIDKQIHICDNYLVYTDIINEQYFGDVKARIIRNVIPQGNHRQVNIIYNSIHYVDICKTEIKDINISIRDTQGDFVRFSDLFGKVVVKLHFKLK